MLLSCRFLSQWPQGSLLRWQWLGSIIGTAFYTVRVCSVHRHCASPHYRGRRRDLVKHNIGPQQSCCGHLGASETASDLKLKPEMVFISQSLKFDRNFWFIETWQQYWVPECLSPNFLQYYDICPWVFAQTEKSTLIWCHQLSLSLYLYFIQFFTLHFFLF